MTSYRALLAAMAALVVLASACAPEEVGPRLAAPTDAKAGGRLVVGIGPPGSVDPANSYEPNCTLISATMCDPLIGVDHETGELVPALEETWQVVEDGQRIIIKLRRGLQFSDGSALTATDVVDSLSRAASATYAGDAAELLSPIVGYAAIRGQDAEAEERFRESFAGVQALTEQTVQISLIAPLADFITVLTHPISSPVSSEAFAANPKGFEHQPVCAGPYRLAAPFEKGATSVRLTRVAGYEGTNDSYTAGGRGYADEIVFRVLPELATVDRSPDADGEQVPDPQVAERRSRLRGIDVLAVAGALRDVVPKQRALKSTAVPGPGVEYVGLPAATTVPAAGADSTGTAAEVPTEAPGDEVAVGAEALEQPRDPAQDALRKALSLALDRTRIARRVYGDARVPARDFVPPTIDTPTPEPCAAAMPPTGDVAAARQLLAEADVALRGQELTFTYNDDFANTAVVREVARQWTRAFGVTVVLEPLEFEEYLTTAAATDGFAGPFRFSWSVPYPTVDQYLYPLFSTGAIGPTNFSGYSDPVFDEVITEQAREASDPEDRVLPYQQLHERLCEALPLIPLLAEQRLWAYRTQRVSSARDVVAGGHRGEPLLRELVVNR